MDTAELRQTLQDSGFSQYQSDAYVGLLELGSASATELSERCGVPTARIYDVLRDLEREGYIETYEQESLRARANDPSIVLEDLQSRASRLSAAAEEIENRWERAEIEENRLSVVKRFETAFDRAIDAIAAAENQVLLAVDADRFGAVRPALERARENGATVKLCLCGDEPPTESELEGVVTEARHRRLPTPFVALVDRSHSAFAPTGRSLNQYGVIVEDRTLTYAFYWYFLTCLWEVWEPIYSARPTEPPITYTDIRHCVREVVPLWKDGYDVLLTVAGVSLADGTETTIEGSIADVTYLGSEYESGEIPISQLAGRVTVTIETDDGTRHDVGGWGAVIEDVEATRITVTDYTPPGDREQSEIAEAQEPI